MKDRKVTKEQRRPRYPLHAQNECPIRKSFTAASNGVYRDSAFLSEGSLPKVIGIDPDHINI